MADFRAFEDVGVVARVTFWLDDAGRKTVGDIDQKTGLIGVPKTFCYGAFRDKQDLTRKILRSREGKLVKGFSMEVGKRQHDDRTLVTSRVKGDKYVSMASQSAFGELLLYSFPQCDIRTRIRNADEMARLEVGKLAVWSNTNTTDTASNRADIWRIDVDENGDDGRIKFKRLLVVTMDDGENFQLIGEMGWEGRLRRRTNPAPYVLQHPDDRATNPKSKLESLQRVAADPGVAKIMHDYVFVPDDGYENFERRLQILLLPEFQEMVQRIGPNTPVWTGGSEAFWVFPKPRALEPNEAQVQFHLYGMSEASQGFATLATPRKVGDRMVTQVQLRHRHIDNVREDDQGLKLLRPGDIVIVDDIFPQPDKTEGAGEDMRVIATYDPIGLVRVAFENVAAA